MQQHGIISDKAEYGDIKSDECSEADDEKSIDNLLNTKLILSVGENNERRGCVTKCSWVLDENPIRHAHNNPLFDTCKYDIEFTNGSFYKYMENLIADFF